MMSGGIVVARFEDERDSITRFCTRRWLQGLAKMLHELHRGLHFESHLVTTVSAIEVMALSHDRVESRDDIAKLIYTFSQSRHM